MRDIPLDVGYNSRIDRANRRLIKHSTSERTSICEECGKPFEQVWRPSKGKDGVGEYTHFKTCGACRMAKAQGYRKVTIPYTPHPAQQKIHDSKARFKLLNCLPPGEIILGANKAIEDVTVGDRVFGNNGSMNRVYRKIERDYNGQLCKVNARYILPFEVTEEHPILLTKVTRNDNYEAFKKGRRPKKTIWNIGESIWVKACDVQKYLNEQTNYVKWCLKIPRIKSENVADEWAMRELKSCKDYYRPHFPVNNDTAWILGLYLAEGHSTKIGLHFGLGLHETEFIERVKNTFADLGYHVHSSESDIDNSASLTVCSVALGEVFAEKYDRYSHNIGIPDDVLLHHDRDFMLNFLRGYFDGDGYLDENKSILYCKTASRKLAMQLQLLIARLGYSAYIHENIRKKSKIRGRYVNNDNPFYMVVCSNHKFIRELGYPAKHKHIREYSFVTDDAIYTPLTSVETRHYSGKVYNLSTDDDTFLVSNIVSHNCGNRFGKDLCSIAEGVMKFLEMENENRSIDVNPPVLWWIVAPSLTYARQNWRDLKKLFPVDLVYKISLSDLTIETINGGIIEVHSADDPESLVGVGLDIVTVTEAPRIRDLDIVWANLRQRLDSPGRGPGGKGGIALLNGTPKGITYFSRLLKLGDKTSSVYSPEYESFHFTTWDNPYMAVKRYTIVGKNAAGDDITFEDSIKMSMTEARYKQDYLAIEIASVNAVFPHYEKVLVVPPSKKEEEIAKFWAEWEKVEPFETYTIGYDPASKGDGKPLVIRNSRGKVVKIDQMTRLGWDAQWDKIAMYSAMYNGAVVNFGQTGLGETIGSQLIKRGLTVNPINEQGSNKSKLVEDLAIIVEQGWCEIPWSQEVENQLKDYISVSRDGRSTQYRNATDGEHDDIVSALYFCFADFQIPTVNLPWVGLVTGIEKAI